MIKAVRITPSVLLCMTLYISAVGVFKVYLYLNSHYEYIKFLMEPFFEDEEMMYDYIIVGCGTAGSLIAHELSNQRNIKFLVLEAGGHGGPLLNPPALGPLLHNTIYDWQYETTPQNLGCLGMKGKICKWTSGKIVGGSGKLNNMIHLSGFIDEIVPWFKGKYSENQLRNLMANLENSDLQIQKLKHKSELSASVLEAAGELGYTVSNLNNVSKTGFMETIVNQKDGARWSTSHAFLNHHSNNGKLYMNAVVEKIIIDPETKTAKGVLYERFGYRTPVIAKRGVILTSGAIGTPKLLLLSGIGPKGHLNELGIPLIKDLPVGENLMDHVTTGLDLLLLDNPLSINIKSLVNPLNALDYFQNGDGPWTSPGCEVVAILKSCDITPKINQYTNKNCTLPDLQLMVMPFGITSDHGVSLFKSISLKREIWKYYFKKIIVENSFTILPVVLHPKSVGNIRLRSKNPNDMPLIDPKYFSNDEDAHVLLAGIEVIKRLINTKAMAKLGARLNPLPFPSCQHLHFDTTEYWFCYIKHLTLTTYHPAGTCRMGDSTNRTSVVDYNFRVIGTRNLYVADASIFPSLPSGNINSAVALVASLFSNKILN